MFSPKSGICPDQILMKKITIFNARAPAVDPGSFQEQVLIKNSSFQCQSSPNRSRQLPRSDHYQKISVFTARAPQSIQAASKIKSLLKIIVFNATPVDPGSFQDRIIIGKISVFNARAPPVDSGSFQDQTLMKK